MTEKHSAVIHVVDDDASFLSAIAQILDAHGYQSVLYASADELLDRLPQDELACILLDVQMAGLSGPELQSRLASLTCKLPIVFITGHGDIPTTVQTLKAGADDFLTKPVSQDRLIPAIEMAIERYRETRERDNQLATLQALVSRLTPREREVFDLLVRGKVHKQIAFAMGISERTVKMHRHSLMQKLQVRSSAELAVIAERLGLLSREAGAQH